MLITRIIAATVPSFWSHVRRDVFKTWSPNAILRLYLWNHVGYDGYKNLFLCIRLDTVAFGGMLNMMVTKLYFLVKT